MLARNKTGGAVTQQWRETMRDEVVEEEEEGSRVTRRRVAAGKETREATDEGNAERRE